jgi:hypothetical protein
MPHLTILVIFTKLLYLYPLGQYFTRPCIRDRRCYDPCEARAFALTSALRIPCAFLWQEFAILHCVDVVLCRFAGKMVTVVQKTLAITIDLVVFIHSVQCVWVV